MAITINSLRVRVADFIGNHFKSAKTEGSWLNRLVNVIDPPASQLLRREKRRELLEHIYPHTRRKVELAPHPDQRKRLDEINRLHGLQRLYKSTQPAYRVGPVQTAKLKELS